MQEEVVIEKEFKCIICQEEFDSCLDLISHYHSEFHQKEMENRIQIIEQKEKEYEESWREY